MKGLIYLLLIYGLVFLVSIFIKVILKDNNKKNKGESPSAPAQQIFYIKNAQVRRKKPAPKPTDITIQGNIIGNDKFNNP